MKANKEAIKQVTKDDSAVSPVIAVILMVAITVVLAATVYVWVSGFSEQGGQAPSASFSFQSCDDAADIAKIKLISGGPLQEEDQKFLLYDSSDNQVGSTAENAPTSGGGGAWSVGDIYNVGAPNGTNYIDMGTDAAGDDLSSGNTYSLDIIHEPTQQSIATVSFTC